MSFCPDPDFLLSAVTSDSDVFPLDRFDAWLHDAIARHRFRIEEIPFRDLKKWRFEESTGNLVHDTGKFFRIEGIEVETDFGSISRWSQPIVNQPEIGILGIITKKIDGVPHFLLQAKMEPGNINTLQLAPTLQATKSNYMRVHQGKIPPFLSYFRGNAQRTVLVDVLQSEQGGRFLRKRNRNIIIEAPPKDEFSIPPEYAWFTLGQIFRLLRRNNVINMDARTVLSCISYHRHPSTLAPAQDDPLEPSDESRNMHSMEEILTWLTEMKCRYDLKIDCVGLKEVREWARDDYHIYHPTGDYFAVIAARVEADNREVSVWTQPLVKPCQQGVIAFLVQFFCGMPHFLLQAKVEPGNLDVVEIAPTVQCLTGDYKRVPTPDRPSFLEYVLSAPAKEVLFDTFQSEEGGRFFREENRNLVVLAGEDFQEKIPDNYFWISYTQLKTLIRFNNIANSQCRSLLSCIAPSKFS